MSNGGNDGRVVVIIAEEGDDVKSRKRWQSRWIKLFTFYETVVVFVDFLPFLFFKTHTHTHTHLSLIHI